MMPILTALLSLLGCGGSTYEQVHYEHQPTLLWLSKDARSLADPAIQPFSHQGIVVQPRLIVGHDVEIQLWFYAAEETRATVHHVRFSGVGELAERRIERQPEQEFLVADHKADRGNFQNKYQPFLTFPLAEWGAMAAHGVSMVVTLSAAGGDRAELTFSLDRRVEKRTQTF